MSENYIDNGKCFFDKKNCLNPKNIIIHLTMEDESDKVKYCCSDCLYKIKQSNIIEDKDNLIGDKINKKCPSCKSKDTYRLYRDDLSTLNCSVKKGDNELKTLGDLANRNRDRMSDDQRNSLDHKHNAYKDNKPAKELPTGMSRIEKPKHKIKWR